MHTRIYWIHQFDNSSRLGIMARPRGGEWLKEEINALKKQQVGLLISLLEPDEVNELNLIQEEELCKTMGIAFLNFPIKDRDVPSKDSMVEAFIDKMNNSIYKGLSTVIHCRMGIGRSSIIAGCLMQRDGLKTLEIINTISKIRGIKVPDTEDQIKWLMFQKRK